MHFLRICTYYSLVLPTLVFGLAPSSYATEPRMEKTRVAILADMGNEPDEEQQIVHLMLYANIIDLQALIAVTGKYLRPDSPHVYRRRLYPELFHQIIDGYEAVLPNLKLHAKGWPSSNDLRNMVFIGQTGYGIDGAGKDMASPGSKRLADLLTNEDPRPLYVVVNAGSNTLAQALIDLEKELKPASFQQALSKLRVYENGAQDNAGAWIIGRYPSIHWIRSNYQTYSFGGPSWDTGRGEQDRGKTLGPYTWHPYEYSAMGQHFWAIKHIKSGHGQLGARWPLRQMGRSQLAYIEGGGVIPWLGLAQPGLSSIDKPHWGGWSGRFSKSKVPNVWSRHDDIKMDEQKMASFSVFTEVEDSWTDPATGKDFSGLFAPVWRWRQAFFNDYQARMDWAHFPYAEANHNPEIKIAGLAQDQVVVKTVSPDEKLVFDASGSTDPDGDKLQFHWWIYKDASSAPTLPKKKGSKRSKYSLTVPKDFSDGEIHIILEVSDNNKITSLFDYQRIVLAPK